MPSRTQQRPKGRQLVIVPLAILAFLTPFLAVSLVRGTFPLSMEFKESSLIRIENLENTIDVNAVEFIIENLLHSDVQMTPITGGYHVETQMIDENSRSWVKNSLSAKSGIPENKIEIYTLGPAVTGTQGEQVRNAIVVTLIVIGVAAAIAFRRRLTIGAILLVVGLDIVGVLGCMALFQVPLSSASLIGILMLIAYAIDTNVLLTWRVLKRAGGGARDHATGSMRTGAIMTIAVLIFVLSFNILTTAHQINELTMTLAFGILINFANTWLLNAEILVRYAERKRGGEYHVSL